MTAVPQIPLDPAAAAAWLDDIERRQARESLWGYVGHLQLGVVPATHHRFLLGDLEALERGEGPPNRMYLEPPGAGKSFYCSQVFPAWYLGRHPTANIIAASHTAEFAERFGRRVRNLVGRTEHAKIFGPTAALSEESQAAGRWETKAGGEYFAAGVGGAIAGRRADLGIIDDPVRSREDADSPTRRNFVWDWYVNDFLPRLKPDAKQLIVMTRWHEDDLGGRILDRDAKSWRVISLPMEAEADDPLGRAPGERLWPEWYTDEMVERAKLDVRVWNALYQQRPAAELGDYFQMDWFGEYEELPERLSNYGASDYAVTEGAGDWTEHGVFSVDNQSNIYIREWWRGRETADVWIERQISLMGRFEPLIWFGEAGPIKRSVEPFLIRRMDQRQTFCRLEWLSSIADKPSRCRSFQALASMGKVFFPKNARWKTELLSQLLHFPAGKYDDGVDVCSLLGRGLEIVKPPTIRRRALRVVGGGGPSGGWMSI
jgi:predicted phage terminase large subunit-like protein